MRLVKIGPDLALVAQSIIGVRMVIGAGGYDVITMTSGAQHLVHFDLAEDAIAAKQAVIDALELA